MGDVLTIQKPDLNFRRINLGCGFDKRPGFLNVDLNDFHSPDYVADISNLKDLPDNHYEEIVAQDVLEHMTREVSLLAFNEWSRILSATGVMKIRVPTIIGLLSMLHKHAWTEESHSNIMLLMFGTQAYNGDFHMSGFTPPILIKMADDAGLMITSTGEVDEWLYDLEFAKKREPTDEEFLHAAYFDILGRIADVGGLRAYASALAKSEITREQVAAAMMGSEEARLLRRHVRSSRA